MASGSSMVCLDDYEEYAVKSLAKSVVDFIRGGSGSEETLRDNTQAFTRYKILPRVLRDVSSRDLQTTILGHQISFPVCLAPIAYLKLAHPEGDLAAVRATTTLGTAFAMSTFSTSTVEEVAEAGGGGLRFFQLYVGCDRDVTRRLVSRAERAGYAAIFVTVDAAVLGNRRADERNDFRLPPHLSTPNIEVSNEARRTVKEESTTTIDPSLTWKDLAYIKSITKLPVVLKGVQTSEDAVEAVRLGLAGVVVSNHGGRQLDTVPATIDILPEVVQAVNGRCEVYLDGGVRTGTDVFKALALGARAVFIGRPAVYGLAYDGENGVRQVLQIVKEEFSTAMALAGCKNVQEVNSSYIRHPLVHLSRL